MDGAILISLRYLLTASFSLLIVGCSGGGGDGTPSLTAAPSQTIVAGSVQAPAGSTAFFRKSSLNELLISEAYAALTGLGNVPDGTIVELARLDATATNFAVLATTTTSAGRYSFSLTSIGVQPTHDLIVRVSGPRGAELHAFVVGAVIDLSPVSEAAYQLTVQSLGGRPLSNLTLDEIADINGAVASIARLEDIGHATAINQAVAIVRTAVDANKQVSAFIAAAGGPGQTTQGTGDVGNYLPLAQGNTWNYQGTRSEFLMIENYVNAVSVNGTVVVNGMPSIIFTSSDSGGNHASMEEYLVKDAAHLVYLGNNNHDDQISPAIIPYTAFHFPLHVNSRFQQVRANDLSLDVDGDGTKETVDVVSTVSVIGFEDIAVAAGSFANTAKVETERTLRINNGITISGTETVWLAPGVGIVKKQSTASSRGNTITFVEELDSYQVDSTIDPTRSGIIANVGSTQSAESMPGKASISSDGAKFLITGCTTSGSNPGIFGVLVTSIGKVSNLFPITPGVCGETVGRVAGPSVVLGASDYFLVYDQRLPFGANELIRGKRISTGGLVLDGSDGIPVSDDTRADRCCAAVGFDGTNYMVIWSERTSGDYKIHGARIAPNGQNLGVFPITSDAPGTQFKPKIAFDGSNYLVIWSQSNSVLTGEDIAGTRVSPTGTVLNPRGFSIATTTLHERNPDLAFDGSNYLVVWESVEPLGGIFANYRIRGTRISKAGTLLDGPASNGGIQINSTTYITRTPSVTFDGSLFLVAWTVGPNDFVPNGSIVGTKVDSNGRITSLQPNPVGFVFSDPPPTSYYFVPSLFSRAGKTIVTWTSWNENTGISQIMGTYSIP